MSRRPIVSRVLLPALSLLILVPLGGCASTPGATTAPPTRAPATPAGGPSTADGLCGSFTADLALAALGVPLDEPTGGDVVPRPNGIYCHYKAAGDGNTNVEAQLKDMTLAEFEALAELLHATTPIQGVGVVAYSRSTSIMGIPGAAVAAWSGGRGVTVSINREGDQAQMLAAAQAIAAAVLASSP